MALPHASKVLRNRGDVSYMCEKERDGDSALSVFVMLVSRNVFHAVSALQSTVCHPPPFLLSRSRDYETRLSHISAK